MPIKSKSIFARLTEEGIRYLVRKECKKIGNLKIDLKASSIQIIKGNIEKINIVAEEINYRDFLFDKFELEANMIKVDLKLINKKLEFKDNPIIKFKISFSENSLKSILFSNNWNWLGKMISTRILNKEKLEEIKISNDQLFFIVSKKDISINRIFKVNLKNKEGKFFLENKTINKEIQIPIEDKIYIENVNIYNNLITIFANSSVCF